MAEFAGMINHNQIILPTPSGSDLAAKGFTSPSDVKPYEFIYLAYDPEIPTAFFRHTKEGDEDASREGKARSEWDLLPKDEPCGHLFSFLQRLKLSYYYLKTAVQDGGCGVQIDKYLKVCPGLL